MAGNKTYEMHIDGAKWTLSTLRATDGLETLTKVIGITGGSLRGVAGEDVTARGASFFGGLALRIAEPGTVPLVKKLLASLHKNDAPVTFDDEFAENYGVLIDLLEWSLKLNFESSLKKSRVVRELREMLATESRSILAGSTGGSGAPSSSASVP